VLAADLRCFDGGHFVLDENDDAIAEAIIETFSREDREKKIASFGFSSPSGLRHLSLEQELSRHQSNALCSC
jgi:hypothetical protein